jgi:hypothetical protein
VAVSVTEGGAGGVVAGPAGAGPRVGSLRDIARRALTVRQVIFRRAGRDHV